MVKLDAQFNLSFTVDSEDWGVAYTSIAEDHSKPLHLTVVLVIPVEISTVLYQGQVELLT